MYSTLLDGVTSIFQALLYAVITNTCVDNKYKFGSIFLAIETVFLFLSIFLATNILGNLSVCVFVTHIAAILVILFSYKDCKKEALIGFTLSYIAVAFYSVFFGNLFLGYIREIISDQYLNKLQFIIMYMPLYVLITIAIINREKVSLLHKLIMNEIQNTNIFVIISFVFDFIIACYLNIYGTENQLLKNIIIIIMALFFIAVTLYFNSIDKKSKQIYQLNEFLERKNNELRKIKHDYGAQISYLYGLHLMKRSDDLGKALKNIIDKNSSIHSGAEVIDDQHSLLSLALKPAIEAGIHVIVEENSSFELSHINEIDIYRIISNIISNAIKAMGGEGIIVAETYDYFKSTVIKIENNGPKIPHQDLENIFKQGFTTKDNKDNSHGYGLAIVKELVEKYNGKISVKSTEASTEFKIIFPIKEVQNV